MDREPIQNLSTRQRDQKIGLMDRRGCRESVEEKPRNLDGSRICQDLSRKGERKAQQKRIYQGSVEKLSSLKKKVFQRREKHIEMKATSKLLKHRSNQHIKLSKHLLIDMQSIHDPKHTHTHTTSLTNFIFQKKVKTVQ